MVQLIAMHVVVCGLTYSDQIRHNLLTHLAFLIVSHALYLKRPEPEQPLIVGTSYIAPHSNQTA